MTVSTVHAVDTETTVARKVNSSETKTAQRQLCTDSTAASEVVPIGRSPLHP